MPDGIKSGDFTVTTGALPGSRKVYVSGERHPDLKVPLREIGLTGGEPPVRVYDTSGPYTDPEAKIDIRQGLKRLREPWIKARGDVDEYEGRAPNPLDNGVHGAKRISFAPFPNAPHRVLRAKPGKAPTQIAYARAGIVTAEMEYIAVRENMGRKTAMKPASGGESFGASVPELITPEFVRDEVAKGRAIIPANINHPEAEPMIIGRNFLVKINANIGNSAISSSAAEEVDKMVWAIRWGG
ncbi:MAG TPA: phosphomethylpyrimidine synthase ThiC, partial [Alphaproteobacteria bacterium]|nr:phosphomethylpyrimidine synthase ThiC [Alphaproteobacteria bacterium]